MELLSPREMTVHKHRIVYIPADKDALEANLDELSRQGWEFVTWSSDWLASQPPSRMALVRRHEPQQPEPK